MRLSILHFGPSFGYSYKLCCSWELDPQWQKESHHICCLWYGSLVWCHPVILRDIEWQHYADLPYVFRMSNKLSKLIWPHVSFRAEEVWQACLGAAMVLLFTDRLTAWHLSSRELSRPCSGIPGRLRFYWLVSISFQSLSILKITTGKSNRKKKYNISQENMTRMLKLYLQLRNRSLWELAFQPQCKGWIGIDQGKQDSRELSMILSRKSRYMGRPWGV